MQAYSLMKKSLDVLYVKSNGCIVTLNENLPRYMLRGSYKEAMARSDEHIAGNHFNWYQTWHIIGQVHIHTYIFIYSL